ncbi:MAG: LTA synthase family protein [Clostridia bacterium]|nr:LTA synthase family protein [Clostridia bacterium]
MNHTVSPVRRILRRMIDPDRPILYFLLAAILVFGVELLSRRSLTATLLFLIKSPLAYLTNYAIILLTLLPALLFRKRIAGLALLSAVWIVLGVAQCVVLLSRVTPLTAIDIAMVLSVISIITSYLTIFQIILICVGLLGVVVGLVLLFIKVKRHRICWRPFLLSFFPALAASVLIVFAGFATGQLSDRFPNLATAYNDYGFPYCFSMSVVDKGVDRPDNYSEDLINDIIGPLSPSGSTGEERAPNVIIIQLESFFDVKYIEGVTYSSDPVPTFTKLKEQYPSGILNVPVIGAGTVNTEFEVLTGMNVTDFGAGEYPFRSIMLETTCETIAYDLLHSGYRTHAIHNHDGSFYLRNQVYPNIGFETFTSIEYFENPTFNDNDWAHDTLLTNEILYLLESTEESDFVFAVSVQGHGKYPDKYVPAEDDITVTAGMEDDTVRSHYNYYINQLNEMDVFISELYEAVMAMEEDTLLVFYGDHLPNIARDEGIAIETGDFQTEYIIISNYDTPVKAADKTLFTYEIFPTVMEVIGNDTGLMPRFYKTYRDDPAYLTLLASLEYDVLYGRRMAYVDVEYPVMDMVMGSRPITVTGCRAEGDYLYITGENFTAYSVVTLDKRQRTTEFVDSTTLRVPLRNASKSLANTNVLTVRQISDMNECLSETAPFYPEA